MSSLLVTGVSRYLGARFAREAAASPHVDRVIGIDTLEPRHPLGGAEFVRADLRNPLIGRILDQAGVDTVVHLSMSDEVGRSGGARVSQKEHNVIGTMHLLAAVQAQSAVRRVVFKSTAAVYGASAANPVAFRETSAATGGSRAGWVRDAVEVEGFVRSLGRRRPEMSTCILRMTHLMGPHVHGTMTQYLRSPVVAVPLGYDARLQLLHEADATTALLRAALATTSGVVNVAAQGVVPLSQALRLARCVPVPLLVPAGRFMGGLARRTRLSDLADEQIDYLVWGRVLDTTRMRDELGFVPAMSTREALVDFARSLPRATRRGETPDAAGTGPDLGSERAARPRPVPTVPAATRKMSAVSATAEVSAVSEVSEQRLAAVDDDRASA